MKTITMMVAAWMALVAPAAAFEAATGSIDLGLLETGRPARVTLWYPKGTCAAMAAPCLADGAMTDRVLLFSHGSMGSAGDYAWLGTALAAAGHVVLGLNHFGESRLYGTETQDVRSTVRHWQRAQDASAVLDRLVAANPFQRPVDWNHVVALGHSAGGQTAALLAGARFDFAQVAAWCGAAESAADLSCQYGRGQPSPAAAFLDAFNSAHRDARVRQLVLLDPALGAALLPESLQGPALPAFVVGAMQTDFLPWGAHGARYAAALQAETLLLTGGEGHFVFLSPCTHGARAMGVSLCEDRPGVDRAGVQQMLAARIIDFLGHGH